MQRDDFVDLLHQTDRLAEGDDYPLVVGDVVLRQRAALAVLEPLLANLVAADVEVPHVLEYALEARRLRLVRSVLARMPLDDFGDRPGYVRRIVPVRLKPFLELGDFARALNLDIELDVFRKAWSAEVAGAYKRLRSDDFKFGVSDVGFRVNLSLSYTRHSMRPD